MYAHLSTDASYINKKLYVYLGITFFGLTYPSWGKRNVTGGFKKSPSVSFLKFIHNRFTVLQYVFFLINSFLGFLIDFFSVCSCWSRTFSEC